MTGPLPSDGTFDDRRHVFIRAVGTERSPEIELLEREETGAELALGSDPHPVAALAEWRSDTGNDPKLSYPVGIRKALCGCHVTAVLSIRSQDRKDRIHLVDDLLCRHDLVHRPSAG